MTRKTIDAYVSILKHVHGELLSMDGAGIIIDFEIAERRAIIILEIGMSINGCCFHFCQALRRKIGIHRRLVRIDTNV